MPARLVIENFGFFGGDHCETSSLHKVLAFEGGSLSEEMLFGLGGGPGFIYWHAKGMRTPFTGMRNSKVAEILEKACRRSGVALRRIETASPTRGNRLLRDRLEEGRPAIVYGDMAYLPYFGMPRDMHFGGHAFVVFGLDEGEGVFHISDRCRNPVRVSIGDLEASRNSRNPPFPPKNRLVVTGTSERVLTLEEGIREGIRDCCDTMLNPPMRKMGLSGIQSWADAVGSWGGQFGENVLECLFNVFLYIETAGTGGSGFRTMYARFLREASPIVGEPMLRDAAQLFEESGRLLGGVASAALPDDWPGLRRVREIAWKKDEVFLVQDENALRDMEALNAELENAMREAREEHDTRDVSHLLCDLKEKIRLWHDVEKKAFGMLECAIE